MELQKLVAEQAEKSKFLVKDTKWLVENFKKKTE